MTSETAETKSVSWGQANPTRLRITRWLMRRLGDLIFFKTTVKVTAYGLENVPRRGPTIVLFNHTSNLDPLVVGGIMPFRDITPLGKQELADSPLTGWIFWGWHAIPLKRGEADLEALKRAIEVLHSKDMLLLAPEGHRQKDGMRSPKEGIAMLAVRTNALIVPIGLIGTNQYAQNMKHLRRTPVTVNIGKPVRLKEGIKRKQYQQVANEIMYQIAPLVTPELRGEFADLSKATMDTLDYV